MTFGLMVSAAIKRKKYENNNNMAPAARFDAWTPNKNNIQSCAGL